MNAEADVAWGCCESPMGNTRVVAVVLAGGSSRRMGGADKLMMPVANETLLDRAVAAVAGSDQIVVVGPRRPTRGSVTWTREHPTGGGPVAAIAAGLEAGDRPQSDRDLVIVVAGDMPSARVGVEVLLHQFCARKPSEDLPDVVVAVDEVGFEQPLLAVWRRSSISRRINSLTDVNGKGARILFEGMRVLRVQTPVGASFDCDSPADLAEANQRFA